MRRVLCWSAFCFFAPAYPVISCCLLALGHQHWLVCHSVATIPNRLLEIEGNAFGSIFDCCSKDWPQPYQTLSCAAYELLEIVEDCNI